MRSGLQVANSRWHEVIRDPSTPLGMTTLDGCRYSFQTVFPPTIVRTARPLSFQPWNGELRDAD
jgi:hypothetical protein